MTDDLDLTWDFAPTFRNFDDDLHTPYVKGASVRVYVDAEDDDMIGWYLTSSDENVFSIGSSSSTEDSLDAEGFAVGEGIAELTVHSASGAEVGHGIAEVLAPDRIVLAAHGYLIMGLDDQADVAEARLLENGTATYLVRYFRDGRELRGNGVLSASGGDGLTLEPRQSYLFENRAWLTLTAGAAGPSSIELFADGERLATLPVVTVPESDIAHVDILTDESGARRDDWLVALAQAYDAQERRIFGVEYAWTADGVTEMGLGDLYRYKYLPGQLKPVTAEVGAHMGFAMLASGGGYVDSSNNIGCATAGRGGRLGGLPGLAGLGLAGLALLGLRRRRS
jgi:hypothetical protein